MAVVSLVVLAVLIALIVALVIVYSRVRELRSRVGQLEDRLAQAVPPQPLRSTAPTATTAATPRPYVETGIPPLQAFRVATSNTARPVQPLASTDETRAGEAAISSHSPETHETPAAPYRPAYIPPPPSERQPLPVAASVSRPSLEARLGQNWLNKLGITALVIGLALGLGKLIVNFGPPGRDAIGFTLAFGILGLGIFLERRPTYQLFAWVLVGGGWALTFFLSYALYNVAALQVLHSELVDLTLMFAATSAMVLHSLRYRSQTVTTVAYLLAFVTVGLSHVTLFSLVSGALLAASLAFIVYRERWYALGLAGLIGVYLNHFLWLDRVLPEGGMLYLRSHGHAFPQFVQSALLLLAYWFIFRILYVLRPPLSAPVNRDHSLEQTLATLTALLNSVGLLGLLKYQSSHPEWAFYGLLALGLAELALSLVARGGLTSQQTDQPQLNRAAFITLSTLAGVLLLAAIPFRFHGTQWPLLWLVEADAFYLAGLRLPEGVFRRIGITASVATGAGLAFATIAALASSLIGGPHNATALIAAAVVLWFNSEFTTRCWPALTEDPFDHAVLRTGSYLAAVLAALALTTLLPTDSSWLALTWLTLALVLAEIADRLRSKDLATQSDLLAFIAFARTLFRLFNESSGKHYSIFSTHYLPHLLIAALLYLAMRRRTGSYFLLSAVGSTYSWIAGTLVALLCWYVLEPISVAVAWGVFGLILFELATIFRKPYLRHQSWTLLVASFIRIFFANVNLAGNGSVLSPSVYTVAPLIAAFAWVYERTHADIGATKVDRIFGALFAWCGLIAAGTLFYFELRPGWIILAWTLLAIALLALAAMLKRSIFVAQSYLTLLAVTVRGIGWHLFSPIPLAATVTTSRVFTITLTSVLLLAALPIAFYLHRYFLRNPVGITEGPELHRRDFSAFGQTSAFSIALGHPEQPFFFVPLTFLTLLLYVQLSGGRITIGWVALGLIAFLFALTVQSFSGISARSYRLAGLGLLMLGVAKVLAWDVWHASPTDRYLTLIVAGASMLLISFLYSRYKETLLKFL